MNLSEVPLIFHLSGKLCGAGIGSIVTGTSEASLENPRLSSLPSGCPGRNSNHWILPVFSLFLRLRIIRIVYTQIFNIDRIIGYIRVSPYIRISAWTANSVSSSTIGRRRQRQYFALKPNLSGMNGKRSAEISLKIYCCFVVSWAAALDIHTCELVTRP